MDIKVINGGECKIANGNSRMVQVMCNDVEFLTGKADKYIKTAFRIQPDEIVIRIKNNEQ
jgi:hypothetical protein